MLRLPTDFSRSSAAARCVARYGRTLPASLDQAARACAHGAGAELYHVFLAAWSILLRRYSDEETISLGVFLPPRSGDGANAASCPKSIQTLRLDFSGAPAWDDILRHCVDFESNGEAPDGAPCPDVIFSAVGEGGDRVVAGAPDFDLALEIVLGKERIDCEFAYNTSLFAEPTIERMAGHFQCLVKSMADCGPGAPVAELPLLTDEERARLLTEWNDTSTDYPREATTHGLFSQWAAQTPEAFAVACGGKRLTYAELDARSNQLARALRSLGAEPESLVGVCLERTEQLAVAMLGILKAGAAYVPLDPDYPPERLAFMLEDTQAPVVVTQTSLRGSLPEGNHATLLLDADADQIAQESAEALDETAAAESLAYIIYTSGSTGTPKGVAVPHRAINRLVRRTDYVDIQPGDRIAQASNASFDAATYEIWGALACGGELVFVPRDVTPMNPPAVLSVGADGVPPMSDVFKKPTGLLKDERIGNGRLPLSRSTIGWGENPVVFGLTFSKSVALATVGAAANRSFLGMTRKLVVAGATARGNIFAETVTTSLLRPSIGKSAQ